MSTSVAEQHLKSQGNQQQANGSAKCENINETSGNYESWRGTAQPHQAYTPSTMSNVNSNYYYTAGAPITYATYAATGVAAAPYLSNYSVYAAVPPGSYYFANGTTGATSGDYASVAQNQWNHQYTAQGDTGKLVDGMQGMSLGATTDPMAAPAVKKQPSWASIAKQPAKQTTPTTLHVKKKGMPPPPMILNKMKLDPAPLIKPPPPPVQTPLQPTSAWSSPRPMGVPAAVYPGVPQGLPPNFLSTPPPHHVPMSHPPPNLLSNPPPSTASTNVHPNDKSSETNNVKDQATPQPPDSNEPPSQSYQHQQQESSSSHWSEDKCDNNSSSRSNYNSRDDDHYEGGNEEYHHQYRNDERSEVSHDQYNSQAHQHHRRSPPSNSEPLPNTQHSQHNRQYRSSESHSYDQEEHKAPPADAPSHLLEELCVKNNYNPDQYELPPRPRFFVIKSYSEDDVHRSIKYEIWCSTDHGNKKLDQAFQEQVEAQGSILLFFSVNRSGHFCGVARMMSAVDYNASSSVWSQDKWKGQFKVEWIYVKDVPNTELRNIILETNENKPVTYCRDTTEVPYEKGIQVLEKIQQYAHNTSLFDDFNHYEQRQHAESSVHHHHNYYQQDDYERDREYQGRGRSNGYASYHNGYGHNNQSGYNNNTGGGYNKRSDAMRRSEWRDNSSGAPPSRRGGRGEYHQSRGSYNQRPRGNNSGGYYNNNRNNSGSGYQRDFPRERGDFREPRENSHRGEFSRDHQHARNGDFARGEREFSPEKSGERDFSRGGDSRGDYGRDSHRDGGRDSRKWRNVREKNEGDK